MRWRSTWLFVASFGLFACDHYDERPYTYAYHPYGGYSYYGRDYRPDRWLEPSDFRGSGAQILDPWLAGTREGRAIVANGFGEAADGEIDSDTADRANIWFRRYADSNRDMRLTDEEIRLALVQASRGPR